MSRAPRPLAKLLLEAHLVSPEMLAAMGELQRRDDRRLGSLLLERRLISAERLAQLLSKQLSLPWVSLQKVTFDPALIRLIPKRTAVRHRVIPVYMRRDGQRPTLYVATDDPTRPEALTACREATGLPVRFMVAAPEEVRTAIETHYGRPSRASTRACEAAERPPARRARPPRRPPVRSAPSIEIVGEAWLDEDAVVATDDVAPPGAAADETREAREADETREAEVAREAREAEEARKAREAEEAREAREAEEAREAREALEAEEAREAREALEVRARAITEPPEAPDAEIETPLPPEARAEAPTSTSTPASVTSPAFVVVGASEGLASDCRTIAAGLGARVVAATLDTLQACVAEARPIVVLVPDEIYEFDPPGLNRLAIGADAHLVVWNRSLAFEDLEPVLEAAHQRAKAALDAG